MHVSDFELSPSPQTLETNRSQLQENEYPGRLIALGRGAGNILIQAYAIMGRSEGSRDRIFVDDGKGIRTTAPSKTDEEMAETPNSELIYYRALQNNYKNTFVVSNGAQTSPILKTLSFSANSLEGAAKGAGIQGDVDLASYEPDDPNFTPRITGVIDLSSFASTPFGLTIVRKAPDSDEKVWQSWKSNTLRQLPEGVGQTIHTYNGNGNPLPSFDKSPYPIPFEANGKETAEAIWDILNPDNRVSVVTAEINLSINRDIKQTPTYHIINRHD